MGPHFGAEPEGGFKYPEWQKSYQDALTELDGAKMQQRVSEAESAIFRRLQNLSESLDHRLEREAIENALGLLRTLKREKPEYSNGNPK